MFRSAMRATCSVRFAEITMTGIFCSSGCSARSSRTSHPETSGIIRSSTNEVRFAGPHLNERLAAIAGRVDPVSLLPEKHHPQPTDVRVVVRDDDAIGKCGQVIRASAVRLVAELGPWGAKHEASGSEHKPGTDRIFVRDVEQSIKRRRIVDSFGCYSLSTVMLKLWDASEEEKQAIEARIMEVLDDATIK